MAAPPASVWGALTEPATIASWLADAELDCREGGAVQLVWPGQGEMRGVIRACDAPSVLEYTWAEDGGTSLVRFEVGARGHGSTLPLVHSEMALDDAIGFGAGWQAHLEALDAVLAGGASSTQARDARYRELAPLYTELLDD